MNNRLPKSWYDKNCNRCPRLVDFLQDVKNQFPAYHCQPVAPFGEKNARLLIVGLAPGKHGANASGRPFTGDFAGILLYQTLYAFGFANRSESTSMNDGLRLQDCRITNAVKCLPPDNKPKNSEVLNCNSYLTSELSALPEGGIVLTLGGIAHRSVLRTLGLKQSTYPFAHNAHFKLSHDRNLVSSYHCSRYNTQTGRLTTEMFQQVFVKIRALLMKTANG